MAEVVPEDEDLEVDQEDEFGDDAEFAGDDDIEDLEEEDADEDVEGAVEDEDLEDEDADRPVTKKRQVHRDDDDEDDELDDDDVEEDLGEILQARLAVEDEPDDEEDEGAVALDNEDRTNKANRVQPKRPEEFVCQSCFLVKHPSQLADPDNMLCYDCV